MKPVLEGPVKDDHGARPDSAQIMTRVRAVVGMLDLDCKCRDKVDIALQRFETLESRRQLRGLILDARHQAERIAALLDFVTELDAITMDETDFSVFEEIALLFEDMKTAATRGADDMVRARTFEKSGRLRT